MRRRSRDRRFILGRIEVSRADRSSGGIVANLKEIARRIRVHNLVVSSAGIAFYGLLALVPTLIALVSIYGLVTDPADIQQQVSDIAGSLDETTQAFVTDLLEDIVGDAKEDGSGGSGGTFGRWLSLILGIGVALWSSSGAVRKLIGTVAVAYEAQEARPGWKLRIMAYGFTTAAIIGVALMALVIGVTPALLQQTDLGGGVEATIGVLQFPVLGLLFGFALTVLYRYSPDRHPRTPWKNRGALVGTLLFIFFAIAFSIYSANVGLLPASYGLLGSIAALMIFLQLTALAVLIGAEVNSAIETRAVARTGASAGAGAAIGTAGSGSGSDGGLVVAGNADQVFDSENSEARTVGFGTALAGLVALFALARGLKDQD
ncbi:MAG: YihY/virulence factor BrkB family protein [Acidimicrobiales bacterium]